jgi:hypothetical protein
VAMPHVKVRVPRSRLLAAAERVMEEYARQRVMLEMVSPLCP